MALSLPLLVSPSVERPGKQRNTSEQNKDIQDVICHGIQLLLFCANLLTSNVRICVLFPFLLDCSPCNWVYKKYYRLTNELSYYYFLPSLKLDFFMSRFYCTTSCYKFSIFLICMPISLYWKKKKNGVEFFLSCSRCACVLVCLCLRVCVCIRPW